MHPLNLLTSTNLVLLFHVVPSIDWFRSTLRTIDSIYKFISIEDIEAYYYGNKKFNNRCHICFDDIDRTFYENAFPVLKEMNIPTTLFVSPKVINEESNYWFQELDYLKNHLGDTLLKEAICEMLNCNYTQIEKYTIYSIFKCMQLEDIFQAINVIKEKHNIEVDKKYNITKEQFRKLNSSNIITIGAHTINHPILSNETDDAAEKEIRESVEELSKMLGRDIKYFAYPNGETGLDYSMREQLILKENKIKLAFTTDTNFFSEKTNPLCIPRSGFQGLKRENSAWILGKLFLVPIWDRGRHKIKRTTETAERKEIKALGLCQSYV